MENRINLAWKTCLPALIFSFNASSATAAGFALIAQDVKGLGNAYAGAAASAESAATIFYNPAGMTRLKGREFVAGIHVVEPSIRFSNTGSTFAGSSLTGSDGGDGGVTGSVSANGTVNTRTSVSVGWGRVSGSRGSGGFRTNDGCTGRWTSVRQ